MPHPTRHRLAAGALALVLALAGAGCGGGDDSSTEQFCERAEAVQTQVRGVADLDVAGDVAVVKERMGGVLDAVQEMLDAAPEDIADEADAVAEALEPLEERLNSATTTEEVRGIVAEITSQVAGEAGARAGARINDKISRDC